jgi:hypothetical protein
MGEDTEKTAEQRMRLLEKYYVGPGRQGPPTLRSAPTATAIPAARVDVIDHMDASVDEIITHTRAVTPDAGPIPAKRAGIYSWAREHTARSDADVQRGRELLIYRQSLEHAIAMGDHRVVRKHPCPACGCWGLIWSGARHRAACVNAYCTDTEGLARTWTLHRLAEEHITRQEKRRVRAT